MTNRKTHLISIIVATTALALGLSAPMVNGAEKVLADRGMPFIIEADTVAYSDVTQTAKFTGRVILQQGTTRIQAQTVETMVDPEGYQFATAKGGANGLVQFEQKRDGSTEILRAQAEQLLYDGKNNVIVLAKRARAERVNAQGKVIERIDANELTYNQLTEVFESNSQGQGRTHVMISPRSSTSNNEKSAP